jgi:hypothetical protein
MMQSKFFENPSNLYGMLVRQEQELANLQQRALFLNIVRHLRAHVELFNYVEVPECLIRSRS